MILYKCNCATVVVTQQMQVLLRTFPFVQVGYGASSAELSDRTDFQYFLRTNPPDDLQASHMVSIIHALVEKGTHDINALYLLYSTGAYGTGAAEVNKTTFHHVQTSVFSSTPSLILYPTDHSTDHTQRRPIVLT